MCVLVARPVTGVFKNKYKTEIFHSLLLCSKTIFVRGMTATVKTIDSLPVEVLLYITDYLSVSELNSCCATCLRWRDVFGHNLVWRPRCNHAVAGYLATAKSLVEPHFVSPDNGDTTLSAVSDWRLNYMREAHLWSNWRHGKLLFNEIARENHPLLSHEFFSLEMFYTNDYILGIHNTTVELWDVREVPTCYPIYTFQREFKGSLHNLPGSDILIMEKGVVQVFSVNLISKSLQPVIAFAIEDTVKLSAITEEALVAVFKKRKQISFESGLRKFVVVNHIFVSVVGECPIKMHIWNIKTGQKLKEELLPLVSKPTSATFCYCAKTKNIVIDYFELKDNKKFVHCYVYNLTQLAFLPFRFQYELLTQYKCFSCDISREYIAIKVDTTLYIYNYCTSELVYTAPATGNVTKLKNLFVFDNYVSGPTLESSSKVLYVVNPSTKDVESQLDVRKYRFHRVSVIHNKVIAMHDTDFHNPSISVEHCTSKEPHRNEFKTLILPPLYHILSNGVRVNEAGTRMIVTGSSIYSIVANFW